MKCKDISKEEMRLKMNGPYYQHVSKSIRDVTRDLDQSVEQIIIIEKENLMF